MRLVSLVLLLFCASCVDRMSVHELEAQLHYCRVNDKEVKYHYTGEYLAWVTCP